MQVKDLIEQLQVYITSNEVVKRFHFDFRDQLDVIVPKHKTFPIVYVAPEVTNTISNVNGYFGQEVTFEIFVLDRINDDRTNILTIMNETSNIINDIIIFFKNHPDINIGDFFNVQPYNDYTVDNLAGNTISLTFLISAKSSCYMPNHSSDVTAITLSNSDFSWSKIVRTDTVLEDTIIAIYLNDILQEEVNVPYNKNQTINIV